MIVGWFHRWISATENGAQELIEILKELNKLLVEHNSILHYEFYKAHPFFSSEKKGEARELFTEFQKAADSLRHDVIWAVVKYFWVGCRPSNSYDPECVWKR